VLQDEVLRLWSEHTRTVLFVTHNLDEAITLSDRIVVLGARPGRIKAIIDVDLPRPRNVIALRGQQRYGELYQQLWQLLRTDIEASGKHA
jgi:NitT/TauT family transport system ATP-binding protein